MTTFQIKIPRAHEKQQAFLDSTAKRKVIVAGRRGGKTTGVAMDAVYKAMEGRRVLEAAPTAEQTAAFWDAVISYLAEPIAQKIVYKHETKRLLILPNKGRIRCKTAHNADTLRGDYADYLILDEYQMMNPDAWDKVGAPMMLDTNGDAVFIGTPLRRNHFFTAYQKSLHGGRWEGWKFTSHDNPHLSKEALEEITADMSEDAYRQEILAEFLEGEGTVFRNIKACMNPSDATHGGHRKVVGVDWGKQGDFTSISVGCADCKEEISIDRFNKIDYSFQRGRLKVLVDKYLASGVLPERNSMGEPIIEQLLIENIPVMRGPDDKPGFMTTASSKPQLIENLALAFERGEWQFQSDPVWTAELEAYERKISPTTGRSQYNAPQGLHDDTVIARALMVWAAGNATRLPDDQPVTESKWLEDGVEDGQSKFRGRY